MTERSNKRPQVVFLQRKPRTVGNYSVEFIFEDVRRRLADRIDAVVHISPYESSGVMKRWKNCLDAKRSSGQVNHITGDVNYLGLLLSRRNTVQTILDCVHLKESKGLKYMILKWFWLVIPERNARFITAISESTKREILRHHACDPDKIKVIPVAISDRFTHVPATFNKQKPRILQLGTAPNKNIPNLILALKGIPCTLHIVGKHNPDYEAMLREHGIDHVYEWGLDDDKILESYRKADIVTLASTYEGFGMPILEAQATGRPVVTSNLFSMPEVAGDAALLVDPTDVASIRSAFERIINDDDLREELVRKGLVNANRYDPNVIANQYLDLYQQIVKETCAE